MYLYCPKLKNYFPLEILTLGEIALGITLFDAFLLLNLKEVRD